MYVQKISWRNHCVVAFLFFQIIEIKQKYNKKMQLKIFPKRFTFPLQNAYIFIHILDSPTLFKSLFSAVI